MSVVGYYPTCDDAVCEDCAPAGFNEGDYSQWEGFESWEEPICIFRDDESDTPTHCKECGELIPHALTSDGYNYVAEYVTRALVERDPGHPVVVQWWEQYGADMDVSDLHEIITNALKDQS